MFICYSGCGEDESSLVKRTHKIICNINPNAIMRINVADPSAMRFKEIEGVDFYNTFCTYDSECYAANSFSERCANHSAELHLNVINLDMIVNTSSDDPSFHELYALSTLTIMTKPLRHPRFLISLNPQNQELEEFVIDLCKTLDVPHITMPYISKISGASRRQESIDSFLDIIEDLSK